MKYILILCFLMAGCGIANQPGTPGAAGVNGTNGANGASGHNALVSSIVVPTTSALCSNNGGYTILSGTDLNNDNILQNSEVTSNSVLCNGARGSTGATGSQGIQGPAGLAPQFTPVIVIEPCGHSSSNYKEALLGLQGGSIFGEFSGSSDGLTVRNTLLPDGSFTDTDDSKCNFSVSTDGVGNRTISWNGSSGSGNTYTAGGAQYTAATQTWVSY